MGGQFWHKDVRLCMYVVCTYVGIVCGGGWVGWVGTTTVVGGFLSFVLLN